MTESKARTPTLHRNEKQPVRLAQTKPENAQREFRCRQSGIPTDRRPRPCCAGAAEACRSERRRQTSPVGGRKRRLASGCAARLRDEISRARLRRSEFRAPTIAGIDITKPAC